VTTPGVITPGVAKRVMLFEMTTTTNIRIPHIPGIITPVVITPGAITPGVITPGVISPRIITPGVITPGIIAPGVITPRVTVLGELSQV